MTCRASDTWSCCMYSLRPFVPYLPKKISNFHSRATTALQHSKDKAGATAPGSLEITSNNATSTRNTPSAESCPLGKQISASHRISTLDSRSVFNCCLCWNSQSSGGVSNSAKMRRKWRMAKQINVNTSVSHCLAITAGAQVKYINSKLIGQPTVEYLMLLSSNGFR